MKFYLISDTHLKHQKVATYCRRPENFTELIDENVRRIVKPEDCLIHLGDVGIDKAEGPDGFMKYVRSWPGKKILVRGNHDQKSCGYYMEHGFDFACDMMVFRGVLLTHKPWLEELPEGTHVNVHGHLHNVWDGFLPEDPEKQQEEFVTAALTGRLMRSFHRLFAVEYTNYSPVDFDKFVSKPDKYQARGPHGQSLRSVLATVADTKCSVPDATGNDTDVNVCNYCAVRGCERDCHQYREWKRQDEIRDSLGY